MNTAPARVWGWHPQNQPKQWFHFHRQRIYGRPESDQSVFDKLDALTEKSLNSFKQQV
jgi:hypothetical protein